MRSQLLMVPFAEWRPRSPEVASLLARVESVRDAARDLEPGLGPAEDNWFAAGMHDSPFAFPPQERLRG